jgi:hypothetical protein
VVPTRRSVLTYCASALLSLLLAGCGDVAELLGIIITDAGSDRVGSDDAFADVQTEAVHALDAGADAGEAGSVCDFSMPFGSPVLLGGLQSNATEGGLRLLPDELTGFFWSSRIGGPGATNLYVATRPAADVAFGGVKLLNHVNVALSLTIDPTVTANGLTLVYRVRTGRNDAGIDDLYSAARPDIASDFASGTLLSGLNSSNTVQPFVLSDGSELYFSSNRSGTFAIYRAVRGSAGFGAPTEVSELNETGENEGDPVLSFDDLTILFSSTKAGGLGGEDIWVAQRPNKASAFAAPVNLGAVNSARTDAPTWLSRDGCRLYLSSDRDGAIHLYLATRM